MSRRGLTLVELLVAIMVGAIVVSAASASLSNMLRAKRRSAERWTAMSRAQSTAERLASDVLVVVRHFDLGQTRLLIVDARDGTRERDQILLLARSIEPVRGVDFVGEGPEFEVQHKVIDSELGGEFWRRRDPAFDEFLDAGGIAARLAQGAVSLSIEATDGTTWFGGWDSDRDGLPHAVRIVVVAGVEGSSVMATARRIVAIDRVEIPPADESAGTDVTGSGGAR